MYLDALLSRCVRPKLSSFKFSATFGIFGDLATHLARDLAEAFRVSNLYLQASKLDIWAMKEYLISSILKIKMKQHLGSLRSPCITSQFEI